MPEDLHTLRGIRLRVSNASHQGGRNYMEDVTCQHLERVGSTDIACFAVFDGHGGREAAVYARDNLWENIKKQPGFSSTEQSLIIKAIKYGFAITQNDMWKHRASWRNTLSGYPSTSGTTCSMIIIIGTELYTAHVGDSGIVMGIDDDGMIRSQVLTTEHKPDSLQERLRIEGDGGLVMIKNGVNRVVWKRPKVSHQGPVRRSTCIDCIPFLAVARSLGDLWSYDYESEKYIISPEPDVDVMTIEPEEHKFLVIGSDGLWNMIRSTKAVDIVANFERQRIINGGFSDATAAKVMVNTAIKEWNDRYLRADNTTSIVVFFESLDEGDDSDNTLGGVLRRPRPCSFWSSPFSECELYGYLYNTPTKWKKRPQKKQDNDHPSLKRSHAFNSFLPSELTAKKPKIVPPQIKSICATCFGYKLLDDNHIDITLKKSKKKKRLKSNAHSDIGDAATRKMIPMCVTKVIIPTKFKNPEGYSSPNRRCYGEESYEKKSDRRASAKCRTTNTIIIPTKFQTPGGTTKSVRRRCFSAEPTLCPSASSNMLNVNSTPDVKNTSDSLTTVKNALPTASDPCDVPTVSDKLRIPLAVKRLKTEQNNQFPETPKGPSAEDRRKVSPSTYTLRRRSDSDLLRKAMSKPVTRARTITHVTQTRSKNLNRKSLGKV